MTRGLILGSILVAMMLADAALAQPPSQSQLGNLETRVSRIESTVRRIEFTNHDQSIAGFVMFFCGAFCALWAQNSGRNAWLWFFLGVMANFITVLVLLSKNSADRYSPRQPTAFGRG